MNIDDRRRAYIMNKAENGLDLTAQEALELAVHMTDWLRGDASIRCATAQDWAAYRTAIQKAAGYV